MQNRRAMLFLVLAAVCGISAAYAVRNYLQAHTPPAQAPVSMTPIGVADARAWTTGDHTRTTSTTSSPRSSRRC